MIRVCLNIDSDPGRKGQVLSVTDPTSDLTLEYKTKLVSQKEFANYASEMKIEYQNPDFKVYFACFFWSYFDGCLKNHGLCERSNFEVSLGMLVRF